jgi:hypothetical protein
LAEIPADEFNAMLIIADERERLNQEDQHATGGRYPR